MNVICWAIVVAAGQGTRMGLSYNKAFMPLMGRPMLLRTLDALWQSGLYAGIVVVMRPQDREMFYRCFGESDINVVLTDGGDTRQQSVYNGLRALPENCQYVAVHDAARPFVSPAVMESTLKSAVEFGSGVACTMVTDTIKSINTHGGVRTLDRSLLRAVQTPQVFSIDKLRAAHEWARGEGVEATDDSALLEMRGDSVHLVAAPGGSANIKMTTPEDMRYADRALMSGMRVGQGYDVHRLVSGRKLILCGVEIPYEMGLDGHSDADVATHALIDALLGAAALGDIGRHFPDTDPRYKGIDSLLLLKSTIKLLGESGRTLNNCDITIVAQAPKLAPYIETMRAALAQTMGVDIERVSVKAKTTERLGFEGEKLGISAQCVAMVAEYLQ